MAEIDPDIRQGYYETRTRLLPLSLPAGATLDNAIVVATLWDGSAEYAWTSNGDPPPTGFEAGYGTLGAEISHLAGVAIDATTVAWTLAATQLPVGAYQWSVYALVSGLPVIPRNLQANELMITRL